MKDLLRQCMSILLACCIAPQSAPCFGQAQTTTPASTQEVQPLVIRKISKDIVIARFQEVQRASPTIQLLDKKLRSLQFTPAPAVERYWGQTATYNGVVEGRPESLIAAIYAHDYVKQNSKDGAALIHVTLTSSSGATKTYSFFLVAPSGDVKRAQEYAVSNGTITLRHSWWSCVQGQLVAVGGQCAVSLATCAITAVIGGGAFSWAAYLACVALACAGAFVKAGFCCACDGGSFCSIFVGTCHSGDGGPGGTGGVQVCGGTKHCCERNDKGECTQCLDKTQECP